MKKKILIFSVMCIFTIMVSGCATVRNPVGTVEKTNIEKTLQGKSALFCGDSICAAGRDNEDGWAGRIGTHYGMDTTNIGKAAASVSTSRGDNRIITQINQVKDNSYDYIILHGGVNDAMESAPIGVVSDSFKVKDFDASTFVGGLEELFYFTYEYFEDDTIIGYIVNYQTPNSKWGGETTDMSMYFDAAIKVCEKWKIPYLDLYNDENFNNKLKVTTNENLLDFLHPNADGYDILYKPIAEWMADISTNKN